MIKVQQLAKDVDVSPEELIEILQDIDITVDGPEAELTDEQIAQVCDELGYESIEAARAENAVEPEPEPEAPLAEPEENEVVAEETAPEPAEVATEEASADSMIIELKKPKVIVKDFAERMNMKPNQVIAELMKMNIFASINA